MAMHNHVCPDCGNRWQHEGFDCALGSGQLLRCPGQHFQRSYADRNLCPECGTVWQHGVMGCSAKHLAKSGLQMIRAILFLWVLQVDEIKKQWESSVGVVGLPRAFAVSLFRVGMIPVGYVLCLGGLGLVLGLFLWALFLIAAAVIWVITGVSVTNLGWRWIS